MSRIARVVVPDVPHHVTQRGNRREDVFFSDADRRAYLSLLAEYCQKHALEIVAYCLMTNHVHLVVVPRTAASLGAAMKPVHLRYAQHVNWTQGISGRLWQGRFFSCPMDERHLWAAVQYVERNPVRAGMVDAAEQYPWSSAAAHCGQRHDPLLADPFGLVESIGDWSRWLAERDDEFTIAAVRKNTHTGRPLGSEGFLDRVEAMLGHSVRPRKVGRPRKESAKSN